MVWLYATLKLLSIVASAFFSGLALLTKYKDEAGRITPAGRAALYGVIGSATLSTVLYFLDVRTAQKSRVAAEAAEQRMLTPLGSMRIRMRIRVPSAQFPAFRDRMSQNSHNWQQPYPMPILTEEWPRNTPAESTAREFFSLIMIACSVDSNPVPEQHRAPEFGKLLVFGLPLVPQGNVRAPGVEPTQTHDPNPVELFYDWQDHSLLLEVQTTYFDDFDTSRRFLSFRDFAGKSLRLAFNVRVPIVYRVDYVEIQSQTGKRRIFVEHFNQAAPDRDTFTAQIPESAFLD